MSILLLVIGLSAHLFSQDIKITKELYEYSENSITGVYVCTPAHVDNGDCRDVDQEYYDNLALISLGSYEIGILEVNGEKTMAFKGPLPPGSAENLIGWLEKHPDITKLTLSSQGGSMSEAIKIAQYVQDRKLDTWVPVRRMCLSACTLIFLAGENLSLDGQLGFHTGEFLIRDPYLISDLERAKKTFETALYENNLFHHHLTSLFVAKGIPLELNLSMVEAEGDYIVYSNLEDLAGLPISEPISDLSDLIEFSKNQATVNFEFQSYTQLY